MAAKQLSDGNPDGVILGQSASDLVGFYGADPVDQPATLTAPAATGATNSSPYGFSEAQANAIVTWIRAMDAIVKANGFTAAS